jgi:hypothetical protein
LPISTSPLVEIVWAISAQRTATSGQVQTFSIAQEFAELGS